MKFYPIVYTRTNRPPHGVDFHFKARPKEFPSELQTYTQQLINEDHFPRTLTQPRRIFVRTRDYIFWGLGLLNEWFVSENEWDDIVQDELHRNFGKKVRGFWGGFIDLKNVSEEELQSQLPKIASMLQKSIESAEMKNDRYGFAQNTVTDCPMLDLGGLTSTEMQSVERAVKSSKSAFPFAERLFLKFIKPDWNDPHTPRIAAYGSAQYQNAPAVIQTEYDLDEFVSEAPRDPSHTQELPEMELNSMWAVPWKGEEDDEAMVTNLILSQKETGIVTFAAKERHAQKFIQEQGAQQVFYAVVNGLEVSRQIVFSKPAPVKPDPVKSDSGKSDSVKSDPVKRVQEEDRKKRSCMIRTLLEQLFKLLRENYRKNVPQKECRECSQKENCSSMRVSMGAAMNHESQKPAVPRRMYIPTEQQQNVSGNGSQIDDDLL